MPPQCRTPPGQKPGYPPGPAPTAPLMAMVSMPLWTDDTSTAVRGYSSSWSPPDTSRAPFPHRSPRRSSANAACGGLKPPPDRRLRRAKPSSPAEHRFLKVLPTYIQTSIPRSWRTSGGPCTTPLRCSPHRSFQGADTHQRDSAVGGVASGAGVVYLAAAPQARAARVIWRCIRLSDSVSHAYLTESLLSALKGSELLCSTAGYGERPLSRRELSLGALP